jgi:hypothetical protein
MVTSEANVAFWHKPDLRLAAPEGPFTSGLPTLDVKGPRRITGARTLAGTGAASAGNYAGSRCRGFVAPGVLASEDFRCTEARYSVFVLMPVTTVDCVDIGDNYTLSQLSHGHCQDARITFGPLREGCDRDMGMMETRAAIAKTTVAPERRRQGRIT